ncbi:MAG: phage baseplate protein [Staphylococcus equorum]
MANNYGGNFTSFGEYLQQNQVRQDRQRYPFYTDNADYNTNSKSYYDDLARKQKLFEILAKRIWEYDKELAKRFEEWDKNLEELPEDVEKLLIEWMKDGTLDEIINENIFGELNDKIDNHFELMNKTDMQLKPKLTASLDSAVPLQSFLHAGKNIMAIRAIASDKSVEDYYLFKFDRNGDQTDAMRINGGSHLENIGHYKGWFIAPIFSSNGVNGKLVSFKYHSNKDYKPYKTISYSDNESVNVKFHNVQLESGHVNVNVFKNILNVFSIKDDENKIILKQYDMEKFMLGEYIILNEVEFAQHHKNLKWLQGIVATDKEIFVADGSPEYGDGKGITIYDTSTGEVIDTVSIAEVGSEDFEDRPINDWNEPEGMDITVNDDGTYNVHLGMFTGGSTDTSTLPTNKKFHIFTWAPKSNAHVLINDLAIIQANLAAKDRLLFYGDVSGDDHSSYGLTDKVYNYKFLTFYFTTGEIGTHTFTVPADRFRFVDFIELQNSSVDKEGTVFQYSMRLEFDELRESFHILHAGGIKFRPEDPSWEGTGGLYFDHPSVRLYHIRGYGMTPDIQDI